MPSRLQLREIAETDPPAMPAARRAYYADPLCSACEEPVERKPGKYGSYLPDLCDVCFSGSVALSGIDATRAAIIRRVP